MASQAAFWNRIAKKYAAAPVEDAEAYGATLDRARAHLRPDASVLEVGCGTGSTAIALAPSVAAYRATDIAARMIEIAQSKPEARDLPHLTFAVAPADADDGPFDAVLAFNFLLLVPDPAAAIRRMAAQLRPGGTLITKTPCLGDLSLGLRALLPLMTLVGKAPRVTFIKAAQLERWVEAAGLHILETADLPKKRAQRLVIARKP